MKQTFIAVVMSIAIFVGCDATKSDKLSPEKQFELSEKCSKAGKVYFNDFIKTNLPQGFLWDNPEYHYSTKLNTCLIHIRYVSPGPVSIHRNQVIDIFSNRTLVYGWFERDNEKHTETKSDPMNSGVPNYTSEEYFKLKDKLFKE